MGGFFWGLGARVTACLVSVGTMLAVNHAAAQSAAPALTVGQGGGLVPPIGGVGHGSRKHKLISPEDYQPVYVALHVFAHSFEVLGDGDAVVASCQSDCQFWVYRGAYHVRVVPEPGDETKTLTLRVSKPGEYSLMLGDDGARDGGLVLGITGSAAFVVGLFVVLIDGALRVGCDAGNVDSTSSTSSCKTPAGLYYGLGAMGVGAGMAAGGFVLFASNITRFRYDGAPYLVTTRVGAVPMPSGGLGLGTTISF